MQALSDEERREILGGVLADELKAIREYVQDVPAMQQDLHQIKAAVDDIQSKVTVLEHVSKGHETD